MNLTFCRNIEKMNSIVHLCRAMYFVEILRNLLLVRLFINCEIGYRYQTKKTQGVSRFLTVSLPQNTDDPF